MVTFKHFLLTNVHIRRVARYLTVMAQVERARLKIQANTCFLVVVGMLFIIARELQAGQRDQLFFI